MSAPFFTARLLVTGPDGTYAGIRGRKRVSFFDDRVEIDDLPIYSAYVSDVRVYGNVLHVVYVASDLKPVELYFKYDSFLPRTGARRLAEMLAHVEAIRGQKGAPFAVAAPSNVIRAESIKGDDNWHHVIVHSARAAFPAECAVCLRAPDAIAPLYVNASISDSGVWFVPMCSEHVKDIEGAIRVPKWHAQAAKVEFAFLNAQYAADFLAMNRGERSDEFKRKADAAPIVFDIRNGTRFVVYQYVMSAAIVMFIRPSPLQRMHAGTNRFIRSLPWSAITLVAGWWSISGLFATPVTIVRNSLGGTDVTQSVTTAVSGAPMTALGL